MSVAAYMTGKGSIAFGRNALQYIASYPDLTAAFGLDALRGVEHYDTFGLAEGRFVSFSGLEYIASYPDLIQAFQFDAERGAGHYIEFGRLEGRNVGFNALEYIASYTDLANAFGASINLGAQHVIEFGRFEGRTTSFDGLEYIASYGDLIAAFGADEDFGAKHFIEFGRFEGRATTFDGLEYIASYGDLIEAFGADSDRGAGHFIAFGRFEGRTDMFDPSAYLARYADLRAAFGTDLEAATRHFIEFGYREGRSGAAVFPDTSPPAAPVLAAFADDTGAAGDGLTADTTPTLTGMAEANATVTVLRDAVVVGTTTADGAGAWSYTSAALADGSYGFTATATDAAGNTGAVSGALALTVDATAPSAPTITGFTDDTGTAGDCRTFDTTPTLSGTAEANAIVTVLRDGVAVGTTTADGAGAWSYTSAALADGSYGFTATATDAAGNTGAVSGAFALTVDATAPSAPTITGFTDDTGTAGDGRTGDATPTLSGTAEALSTVTILRDGVAVGTTTADGAGAWSYTSAALADGSYGFTATATDAAGNTGAVSATLAISIDATAPAAPVLVGFADDTGVAGDGLTADTTPTLTGTAEANATVTVLRDGVVVGTTTADGSGAWSYTSAALADGSYGFTATATDAAGNMGAASATLAISIDATASAAPVLVGFADDTGVAGDGLTADTTPTLTGTAEANATVTVLRDGVAVGTTTADGAGAWSYTSAALADGSYGFTATATDAAGNIGTASVALAVTVDATAPSAPTITGFTDDTGTAGDGRTFDTTPTLSGTAEANATVTVLRDGVAVGTATADGAGAWSYTSAALADGGYGFTATATDAAGNTGAASATFGLQITSQLVFDLTSLTAAQGFVIQGDVGGDRAGYSVSAAGDVNGDGFADLIVGARAGDDGGAYAGEAYVVFGSGSGFGTAVGSRRVLDLTSLTAAQGFVIQGDAAGDYTGASVSSAGDVNGDGFADLIVGALFGDDGGGNAGEAYVVFGSGSGFGAAVGSRQVLDLTNLSAAQGFVIQGDAGGDQAGFSVSSAGDVNGDGFSDLLVGAPFGDDGGNSAGEAYVVFGSGSGTAVTTNGQTRQVLDLTNLTAAQGFVIRGDAAGDRAGRSVSSAGDVNGDGFADLLVGAPFGGDGGVAAGDAYLVFGSRTGFGTVDGTGRQVLDLTNLSAAQGFVIQGDAADDLAGWSVSSAGDVNGDGFADLIVGARYGDDGGTDASEAYVVFGSGAGFGTTDGARQVLDLTSLSAAQGFVIQGDAAGDLAGRSVSSAGDVNGDGFADLIVGAPRNDDGGSDAGEAYVVFGSRTGFGTAVIANGQTRQVLDLTDLTAAQGFVIQGDAADDQAGFSVSSAGDVNGDGFADLIVGAPNGDDGGTDAGEAYILFGGAFGGSAAPVTTTGTTAAEFLIGGAGDDVLTGGGGADAIRGGAGNDRLSVSDNTFRGIDGGTGSDTLALDGTGQTLDLTGRTLAARIASVERIDLTGTGADTLVLDRLAVQNLSEVRVGGVAILTVTGEAADTVRFTEAQWADLGSVADGGVTYTRYGHADGSAEVRVAAGVAAVFPGGNTVNRFDLTNLTMAQGFVIQGDAGGDLAGNSVSSAGDVNGDGFADLIVGANGGDDGGGNAGEASVVFGSGAGFGAADGNGRRVLDLTNLSAAQGFVIQGDAAGDYTGASVSSAGDVNGDGFADLIVGASSGDDGGGNAGEAYVVFGSGTGFGAAVGSRRVLDLTSLTEAQGFVIQGDAAGDYSGFSVSSAGDVNGDGFADLIVGAPLGDDGGNSAGEVYVAFGSGSGFGTVVTTNGQTRQVLNLTNLSAAQGFVIQGDAAGDQAGFSVSSAGDVNGDGFADLIVGARSGDDGGPDAGEAYAVFGSGAGFGTAVGSRQVLDLTNLTAAQGFVIQGDAADDLAGWSVSSAGDVNGDGFADLIVGARGGDDGGNNAGEAYVVFGSGSGFGAAVGSRQVLDLTNLSAAQGFVIQGDAAVDLAGRSVSSAGDVNGDGFADLIVGAPYGDDGGNAAGEAYVLFGSGTGFGTAVTANGQARQVLDLTNLTAAQGFVIQGDAAFDLAGRSVSSAGDVDGDGFADLLVGAPNGDDGGTDAGEAYILFGGAFGGSAAPVTTTGTIAAEFLIGGIGNDVLTGGGGADALRGGAGNDRLSVTDTSFRSLDGGTGIDTLALDGAGQILDLTGRTLAARIASVERIDLTGTGADTLVLDRLAVQNLSEVRVGGVAILTVTGEAADTVRFTEAQWADLGSVADGGVTYTRYGHADGSAEVRVAAGVAAVFPGGNTVNRFDLTGLTAAQGFVIQGDAAFDRAGFSVSSAGDVDGDGFADLIVGAPYGDGGPDVGEAYVVFGSGTGFGAAVGSRQVLDLTNLTAAQGFVIQGDAAGDGAGWSVSSAGDVNGDGFADLIVGAPYGDDGGGNAGEAYVVFGSGAGFGAADGNGRRVLDLTNLSAAQGFVIQGDASGDQAGFASGDQAGFSVSSAGDVDGDGFADLIVGARYGDDGGAYAGEAYVVFGSGAGFGAGDGNGRRVLDLTNLTAAQGFVIQGDTAGDLAGYSVSAAGDVNGDGFSDLIVGANGGDDGGGNAGEAYVVFGSGSGFGTAVGSRRVLDLTSLTSTQGFVIQGDAIVDQAGRSVSSAGDVNGDGFADLIVGAPFGGDGGSAAGEAYVVFGSGSGFGTADGTGRQILDLTSLSAAQGFVIQGDAAGDWAGYSVSSAGDVDGDGFADLIVGAPRNDDGGPDAGEAYVVFGSGAGFGTADGTGRQILDLTNLTAAQGFVIQGDAAGDLAGRSVSSAGDVDGDGFADLIVGAPFGDDGGIFAGEAYVVFGGAFGGSAAPMTTTGTIAAEFLIGRVGNDVLTGGGGADAIRGGAGDDRLSVSDNTFRAIDGGTGIDTLALDGAGQTLDLTGRTLAARIASVERIDLTGTGADTLVLDRLAVQNLSEVRANGVAILTVTGEAADTVRFTEAQWANLGSVADGGVTYTRYGHADGSAEVRVAAGVAAVFPGGNTVNRFDLTGLTAAQGFVIQGDAGGDRAGYSVSSAGDVNGDGFADLIVGAPNGDDGGTVAGEAYVVFGSGSGFGAAVGSRQVLDLTNLSAAQGFVIQGDTANDLAGRSLSSAGDVNGDGFADLIVGALNGDDGGNSAGEAYVVFGSGAGFGTADGTGRQVLDLTSLGAAQGFVIQGDATGDQAGYSVSSAGDVNGDGFADLIVGARNGGDGGAYAGEAYVVFGSGSGFGTAVGSRQVLDLTSLSAAQGFVIQGDAAGDRAGRSVSSAGDVDGDGFADLIVGALNGDDGGNNAGEAYVVFGSGSGFGAVVGSRQVLDLTNLSAAQGFVIQGDAADDQAGFSVSAAGDVNGDGFADLIVGAPFGDDGGTDAGEAYVVFGSGAGFGTAVGSRQVLDLTNLTAAQGFVIQGDAAGDRAGDNVSAAGDVNGDGFADLIVGAPRNDDGGTDAGDAYVVFGSGAGFGTAVGSRQVLDLTNLTAAQGFVIQGDAAGDVAGFGVSSAGDVDGDGFADLIVGALNGDDGGINAGEAYILFGGAFGGSAAPVTTTGTIAAEFLIGGVGNDVLTGGGGSDSFRAGAGDDRLSIGDLTFRAIDGGSGTDTLALAGTSGADTFDFGPNVGERIHGIEAFDFSGAGTDTLVLYGEEVFTFSDTPNATFTGANSHNSLVITADAGDRLDLRDFDPDGAGPTVAAIWTLTGSDVGLDGSAGGAYDVYDLVRGTTVIGSVAVDNGLLVI